MVVESQVQSCGEIDGVVLSMTLDSAKGSSK